MMAAGRFQFRAVLQLIACITDDPIEKEEGVFIQLAEPDARNPVVIREHVFLKWQQQIIGFYVEHHEVLLAGQRTEGISPQMVTGHVPFHVLLHGWPDPFDQGADLQERNSVLVGQAVVVRLRAVNGEFHLGEIEGPS